MKKDQIVSIPIKRLKPYKNNPRNNRDAVDAVAASIKAYGFHSPIAVQPDGTIINGHTRYQAAKKLGLEEVPCVIVSDLSEEQVKEYRLIDNKSAEYSSWDKDLLSEELEGLGFDDLDFGFDFSGDLKKVKRWEDRKRMCDLKDKILIRKLGGGYCQSIFKAGPNGKPLKDLKTEEYVKFFAETMLEFIREFLGGNLSEGNWCVITTPRRRHAEGFHFATAVSQYIADDLRIPFYPDAITCKNRCRVEPHFDMETWPKEKNVLLYDDIITTGCTIGAARELLLAAGYTVVAVVSINNH